MTTTAFLFIAVSAALVGAAVGIAIYRLAVSVTALRTQLDRLEQSARQRNPYRTNESLEDAMAIVHDAVWQADATLDYVRARMKQVDNKLQVARTNPDSYDPDERNQKHNR